MANRPFFNSSIADLERLYEERRGDDDFVSDLIAELENRETQRARKLLDHVKAETRPALVAKPSSTKIDAAAASDTKRRVARTETPFIEVPTVTAPPPAARVPLTPNPEVRNKGTDILSAWTGMEVLSPPSFRKPEDLAGGERQRVARFVDGRLPWEGGGEKSRPNYRLYYQIVLGTVDMEKAVGALLGVYSDTRDERPSARGEAVLATVLVDRLGRLVDIDPVAISSFGWGVPVALAGRLEELRRWPDQERQLLEGLSRRMDRRDDEGEQLPLDRNTIANAYAWLVGKLALGRDLLKPPEFALRSYQYYKFPDPPEAILLNSFFLNDLATARRMEEAGRSTSNVRRYLQLKKPAERHDLLSDRASLRDALQPARFPVGSWPGPGRNPLALLQQTAVNLALHDLGQDGILAVNGPPGTGKTTLLRDVIAGIVSKRAEVMCGYDDPETAFISSGQRLKRGQAFVHLYRVDDKLRGHEIVVASSNNKAVENVSAELPGIGAIAGDASSLRYFKSVSDSLLDGDSWGAVAAVLGNARNRSEFRQKFWWDEELGLQRYFQHASGNPQYVTETHGEKTTQRPPRIVTSERPPDGKDEALARWKQATARFRKLSAEAKRMLAELQEAHDLEEGIKSSARKLSDFRQEFEQMQRSVQDAEAERVEAAAAREARSAVSAAIERDIRLTASGRPGFLARLLKSEGARKWQAGMVELKTAQESARGFLAAADSDLAEKSSRHARLSGEFRKLGVTLLAEQGVLETKKSELATLRSRCDSVFVSATFFDLPHRERQLSAPWLTKEAARIRNEVFEAAMSVHRAFADAAARPLRHNLNALMDGFGTRSLGSPEKDALIPHLWSTLFLIVPAVSTTFASVGRMFENVGSEQIGWLLVDEAGQALPQAAVGAMMRCKRAVVVGDPVQIEPVVVLPDKLTEAVCLRFGVDAAVFNAPSASVQTLADAATGYFATFETKYGSRDVGVPLLVHRRCANPMFAISNSLAYENLMVQAKVDKPSAIRSLLGDSRWLHVEGRGQDKWCEKEGKTVLDLLDALRRSGVTPDLYVVTPFVVVQDRMREIVRASGLLNGWVADPYLWARERIGTVHTVQGREAEAVIFVLGAPEAVQRGARGWAGARPNLLNVAVTRAKEAVYVVGNRTLWKDAGVFQSLDRALP